MVMNDTRTNANLVSALLCVLTIVFFLAAPFYNVLSLGINGFNLIRIQIIAIIPVLLGVVAALGACIFPPIPAIILETAQALVMLLFMCLGNTLISSIFNTELSVPTEWASSVNAIMSVLPMYQASWGAVVCLILSIIAVVIDVLVNLNSSRRKPNLHVIGQDTGDPFSGGLF